MVAAAEAPLVYAFAAMLAIGAAIFALLPLFRHLIGYAASRASLTALAAACVGLAALAVFAVVFAVSDPNVFLPIAGIVVVLRILSPSLLYLRIRGRFDAERTWTFVRVGVAIVYIVFVGDLGYGLLSLLAGQPPSGVGIVSEQLAMAIGASVVVVRGAMRIRPRGVFDLWPAWTAATLLAVAFVVVAPYAFPGFAIAYVVSGLIGWTVGAAMVRYAD
jgi:hypothetical protein